MTTVDEAIAAFAAYLPDHARDLRINAENVFKQTSLDPVEAIGCGLAAAVIARSSVISDALSSCDAIDEAHRDGALAAGSLMAMNTTWYPFIELSDDAKLSTQPVGLRMQAYAKHGGIEAERFEAFALCAAIVGRCGYCIRAHNAALLGHGRSHVQLRDIGRIAATINRTAAVLAVTHTSRQAWS